MGRVALFAAVAAGLLACAAPVRAAVVARPRGDGVVLRASPGGTVVTRLGPRPEFGSPLVLAVAARRGQWLGVMTPQLPNGKLAWVDKIAVRTSRVWVRVDISLSTRTLWVFQGKAELARFPVGVGSAASPTPTGRLAVTDRLPGARFSPVYGCCILALSAHQPHPPVGWSGSDTRIAIHGGALGAGSSGCVHATTDALRFLMAHVPLGARVTIRP